MNSLHFLIENQKLTNPFVSLEDSILIESKNLSGPYKLAALAQLGERQTEDLEALCSIHRGGNNSFDNHPGAIYLFRFNMAVKERASGFDWFKSVICMEMEIFGKGGKKPVDPEKFSVSCRCLF
jgi:hypothetical protein